MNLRDIFRKIPAPFLKASLPGEPDVMSADMESMSEEEFQSLMAESADARTLTVEVVYLTKEKQFILEAQVPRGANIEDGIVLSGLLEQCDEVDLAVNKVGLFGMIKPLSEVLSDGDRIEIYRPVTAKE